MVNVVVVLKVWGLLWANKEIFCENRFVVDVLSLVRPGIRFWLHVLGMCACCRLCITFQLWFHMSGVVKRLSLACCQDDRAPMNTR